MPYRSVAAQAAYLQYRSNTETIQTVLVTQGSELFKCNTLYYSWILYHFGLNIGESLIISGEWGLWLVCLPDLVTVSFGFQLVLREIVNRNSLSNV